MNLTLLHFPEGTKGGKGGPDWAGLHHIGFLVEDEKETASKIETLGGAVLHAAAELSGGRRGKEVQGPQRHRVRRLGARLAAIQSELMRIVAVTERTIRLATAARNASIGFDGMTASAVAVHTDARRNGKPLVGLAFDSIGRYGHGGLLRERFIPRLLAAEPRCLCRRQRRHRSAQGVERVMTDEKPGGHGERCGAVGLIDAALWDLAAKQRGRAAVEAAGAPARP